MVYLVQLYWYSNRKKIPTPVVFSQIRFVDLMLLSRLGYEFAMSMQNDDYYMYCYLLEALLYIIILSLMNKAWIVLFQYFIDHKCIIHHSYNKLSIHYMSVLTSVSTQWYNHIWLPAVIKLTDPYRLLLFWQTHSDRQTHQKNKGDLNPKNIIIYYDYAMHTEVKNVHTAG